MVRGDRSAAWGSIRQNFPAAIAELAAYSMVAREGGQSFTVHRMVQDVLRSKIPEERQRDWIERSLRLVNDFSPPTNLVMFILGQLGIFSDRIQFGLSEYADNARIAHPTSRCSHESVGAATLSSKGLYRDVEPLMRRAPPVVEDSLGPDHPKSPSLSTTWRIAAGHEPAGGSRAADAAGTGDRRAEPTGPITPTSPPTSTTWRRCCRTRTVWRRPSR